MEHNLLIIGKGYTGEAMLALAWRMGWRARITSRSDPDAARFDDPALLEGVTHLAVTAPPGPAGDPLWAAHGVALRAAPLAWVGYISTTGVYGDRKGEWVDETSHPTPGQDRSRRRLEAEQQWAELGMEVAVDIFRTGGIYGPGRSALDDVRSGTARRVISPGHAFSRIHRDDIARAVLAAASRHSPSGVRILHLVDDDPSEQSDVTIEAARLLGVEPPPAISFEDAYAKMSEMGRTFWTESRRVSSRLTKQALGIEWAYPTYREGLAGILAEEGVERPAQ